MIFLGVAEEPNAVNNEQNILEEQAGKTITHPIVDPSKWSLVLKTSMV
jgi:hypothetical protein